MLYSNFNAEPTRDERQGTTDASFGVESTAEIAWQVPLEESSNRNPPKRCSWHGHSVGILTIDDEEDVKRVRDKERLRAGNFAATKLDSPLILSCLSMLRGRMSHSVSEEFIHTADHSTNPILNSIEAQVIAQGITLGIKQGIKQGIAQGEHNLVLKLLALRFGLPLPDDLHARFAKADSDDMLQILLTTMNHPDLTLKQVFERAIKQPSAPGSGDVPSTNWLNTLSNGNVKDKTH